MAKISGVDAKVLGQEPSLSKASTKTDVIIAYNWFNHFYSTEDAKDFILSYLKKNEKYKDKLKALDRIDPAKLRTIGWNFRILQNGGQLPDDVLDDTWKRLDELLASVKEKTAKKVDASVAAPNVQENIHGRMNMVVSIMECMVDAFVVNMKPQFDPKEFFREHNIKGPVAKKVVEYYKPLYEEVMDAIDGTDEDLKYAYKRWKKSDLKKYAEHLRDILAAGDLQTTVVKATRKPRRKKIKPASVLVSKLKYMPENKEFELKSINPTEIVGAQQIWVFNTKTRVLGVYNAIGTHGLSVKGSTITGFDEKTSVGKTLRKPKEHLQRLLAGGKIVLRKFIEGINAKEKQMTGRLNTDVILVRAIR